MKWFIEGTHLRIPLFGERGDSLLDLEAVARHIIMRQHLVPEVGISVFQQCLEEVAVAHITGCQPVVMRINIIVTRCWRTCLRYWDGTMPSAKGMALEA